MLPATQTETLRTPEDCAKALLGIFVDRFKCHPGEALRRAHLEASYLRFSRTAGSLEQGVALAARSGWIEEQEHEIRLTEGGYAEVATPLARELLALFVESFGCTAGGMIGEHNALGAIQERGLNLAVYTVGVQHAIKRGWIVRLPSNASYRLTDAGFAEATGQELL